jgi:hypothetical protein
MNSAQQQVIRLVVLLIVCAGLTSCEDVQVYGSVSMSSYGGGGYYGPGYGPGYRPGYPSTYGGRVTMGGRIY